jgi:hypothetical protein
MLEVAWRFGSDRQFLPEAEGISMTACCKMLACARSNADWNVLRCIRQKKYFSSLITHTIARWLHLDCLQEAPRMQRSERTHDENIVGVKVFVIIHDLGFPTLRDAADR